MDAPGRLHHQLIPRITRGCIYIKGVNNKKFNHASRRQLINAFHSYWRSSVPSIPAEQLMGTCRCPFHRAAIMAVITCGAKFVSHKHKYYKYIKLYGRTRTSTPPANTSYHTRVIFIKGVNNKKFNHASRRQLVNAFHSYTDDLQ